MDIRSKASDWMDYDVYYDPIGEPASISGTAVKHIIKYFVSFNTVWEIE